MRNRTTTHPSEYKRRHSETQEEDLSETIRNFMQRYKLTAEKSAYVRLQDMYWEFYGTRDKEKDRFVGFSDFYQGLPDEIKKLVVTKRLSLNPFKDKEMVVLYLKKTES
jgi:hypothetical protein